MDYCHHWGILSHLIWPLMRVHLRVRVGVSARSKYSTRPSRLIALQAFVIKMGPAFARAVCVSESN